MSTRHDPAHATELAALLAGELSLDDPAARALLARCPDCRAAWRALAPVAREVGLAELDPAELQAAAIALPTAPGSDLVASTLNARARTLPGYAGAHTSVRKRRGPLLLLIAAAATILLLFLARPLWWPAAVPDDDMLLGDQPELVHPKAVVAQYPPFEWTDPDTLAVEYEVRIWDLAAPPEAPPLVSSGRIRAQRWTPDATELARLPAAGIRWSVRGFGKLGPLPGEPEASARLSPR